jgi:hypothetical protein
MRTGVRSRMFQSYHEWVPGMEEAMPRYYENMPDSIIAPCG